MAIDLEGFDITLARKVGHLCHNRRCTAAELAAEMDAHPRRAKSWLARLVRLGFLENDRGSYYPTSEGWETLDLLLEST